MIEYIGMPYSFRDFNCWDFAVKVRADKGLKTKLFRPRNLDNAFKIITAEMQKLDSGLTMADTPENYDIVISKRAPASPIYHCGIYLDGDVFHCDRTRRQVVKDLFSDFEKLYGSVTFWR